MKSITYTLWIYTESWLPGHFMGKKCFTFILFMISMTINVWCGQNAILRLSLMPRDIHWYLAWRRVHCSSEMQTDQGFSPTEL